MKTLAVVLVLAQATGLRLAAQTPPQIPIRALSPVAAKTTTPILAIGGVQQLPDGRLLVNDIRGLRLVVFDSSLAKFTVLADTARTTRQSYGGRIGAPLIPYLADSTLFVDAASQSLILIEPNGTLGRVMSPPIARTGVNMPYARADSKGRLVYRVALALPPVPLAGGGRGPGAPVDSALLVRADFDTRQADTIASVKVPVFSRPITGLGPNGKRTARMSANPVPPPIDDWTILSDGSIAIVRGRDYHVDWIYADGTRASTPKMPFDWRKLTDDEKLAKVDSAKRYIDSMTATGHPINLMYSFSSGPDGVSRSDTIVIQYDYVPLDSMASYVSPVRTGYVKADADGNLWILPTTSLAAKGGLLYDVVNKKGEIFERVQLPADRDIAGFGRGGIVYLSWRDGTKGYYIERTKIVMQAGAAIHPRPSP